MTPEYKAGVHLTVTFSFNTDEISQCTNDNKVNNNMVCHQNIRGLCSKMKELLIYINLLTLDNINQCRLIFLSKHHMKLPDYYSFVLIIII